MSNFAEYRRGRTAVARDRRYGAAAVRAGPAAAGAAVRVGYVISRGIAKSGTRSHADDPREHLDLDWGQGT